LLGAAQSQNWVAHLRAAFCAALRWEAMRSISAGSPFCLSLSKLLS
jgi:hypothetical protein